MTGFGKASIALSDSKISIEIRSLNSKNLDIHTRVPQYLKEYDLTFRGKIRDVLKRGKIDVSIHKEDLESSTTSNQIATDLVKQYMTQLEGVSKGVKTSKLLEIAMRMPDVLQKPKEELEATEIKAITKGLEKALFDLNTFREKEGKELEKEFVKRIGNIQRLLEHVIEVDPTRIEQIKQRLHQKLAELKVTVDENRFEQELIYYLEKLDITEEKVRLANHLNYFLETLQTADSNGKKLGFISQEIGREINTIGSKVNFAPMQKHVVQMKDELEKIKEQLLNVL